MGHVYQGPNGDFCDRNRWDNKSWRFTKIHLKPENTFVMSNIVTVMFFNLTLSSFLHKCRSTASTQVHLQVGLIQQVILQVSHLQWNIVNLFLIMSRQMGSKTNSKYLAIAMWAGFHLGSSHPASRNISRRGEALLRVCPSSPLPHRPSHHSTPKNWNCNQAMMTKLIFNLGGESGGGGGGAKVAEGGMSPWRGYFQCFFPYWYQNNNHYLGFPKHCQYCSIWRRLGWRRRRCWTQRVTLERIWSMLISWK